MRLDVVPESLPAEGDSFDVPGGSAVIGRKNGAFEFRVASDSDVVLRRSGADYAVRTAGVARFGPADDTPYLVKLTNVKARLRTVDKERRAFLEPGVLGELELGGGQGW